eukprot:gene9250-10227_t
MAFGFECKFDKTVRSPALRNTEDTFGDTYTLQVPNPTLKSQQNFTKCLWLFSAPPNFLLNILFINSTFPSKQSSRRSSSSDPGSSSGPGSISSSNYAADECGGNYVIVRQKQSPAATNETANVLQWPPYCSGRQQLSDVRVNGTVEIELHFDRNDGINGTSLTIYAEASSKGCGGIFDGSAHGLAMSYDAQSFDFTPLPIYNIAHCVWFLSFNKNTTITVIPTAFKLAYKMNGHCRYFKEFFSIRKWDDGVNNFAVDLEECSTFSSLPRVLNSSSTGHRFALTIHSEYRYRRNEIVEMVYFPTTPGYTKQYSSVTKFYQEVYDFQSPAARNKSLGPIAGLFLAQRKLTAKNDIVHMLVHDVMSGCEGASIEIWTLSSDAFRKNKTAIAKRRDNLNLSATGDKVVLVYFRFGESNAGGLKMSYFATDNFCGGIFQLRAGQNTSITSPKDQRRGSGYPDKSNCYWAILADDDTKLNISTKYLRLEPHPTCGYDYVNIYQGFRKATELVTKICKPLKSPIRINGDVLIQFHSDQAVSFFDGFQIDINATRDFNVTSRSTATPKPCDTTTTTAATTTHVTTRHNPTVHNTTSSAMPDPTVATAWTRLSNHTTEANENKSKQNRSSSKKIKTYVVVILAAFAGVICAASIAAIVIRRRKRSNSSTGEKSDPSAPGRERQRQNSAMPLVAMDDIRKPHGEGVFANMENPYYASSESEVNNQPLYTDVCENVYAEPKRTPDDEYSYAEFPNGAQKPENATRNNEYAYARENSVENEYEI